MAVDCTTSISGNLTRDPELRYTTSGRPVLSASVAVNRRYQVSGEWEEEVSFIPIVAWGDLAEHAAESLSKGARVVCSGRLVQRSWETKEGDKRSTLELVATDLGPSLRWATADVKRQAGEARQEAL